MDSYYPVLSGVLDKSEETKYIKQTLEKFYVSDLGIKCVSDQPWVTVAETCEFVIALMKVDEKDLAKKLLTDVIQISDENMIPYMGWQYKEKIFGLKNNLIGQLVQKYLLLMLYINIRLHRRFF